MNKTFNILSIDGGGILGLYSADILEKIKFFLKKSVFPSPCLKISGQNSENRIYDNSIYQKL